MASLQYVIKLTGRRRKLEKDYLPDALKELITKNRFSSRHKRVIAFFKIEN